jgi:hypothetical protein
MSRIRLILSWPGLVEFIACYLPRLLLDEVYTRKKMAALFFARFAARCIHVTTIVILSSYSLLM